MQPITRYVAFYRGMRHEFEAHNAYEAGLIACRHFNTADRFRIAIVLHSREAEYLAGAQSHRLGVGQ